MLHVSNGELHAGLNEVIKDVRPEILFIETTGIADPVEVIDTCTALDLIEAIEVKAVVTVLDVEHGLNALRINDLAPRQLELASVIVLNKMDWPDPAWFPQLQAKVREIAPTAQQIGTVHCDLDAAALLDGLLNSGASAAQHRRPGTGLPAARGRAPTVTTNIRTDMWHSVFWLNARKTRRPCSGHLVAAGNVIRASYFRCAWSAMTHSTSASTPAVTPRPMCSRSMD